MAAGNFDKSLARVLVYEGGNDDDPRDPGGRTSRGILQREYDRWLKVSGKWAVIADHDVWKASGADIRSIYKTNYWDRARCEELPAGVDFTIFDGAVNSGLAQCAKWAQREVGAKVDGDFGPATLLALQSANDNDQLIAGILRRRLAMLQGLKTWKYYGKGWSARVANVLKIGQAWATGSVGPNPVAVAELDGHRKALVADLRQPIVPVSSAQVATALTGASAGITEATRQLQPVADQAAGVPWLTWVGYALGGLTVAGIVVGAVASIASARAEKASSAEARVEIDPDADLDLVPVSVMDLAA